MEILERAVDKLAQFSLANKGYTLRRETVKSEIETLVRRPCIVKECIHIERQYDCVTSTQRTSGNGKCVRVGPQGIRSTRNNSAHTQVKQMNRRKNIIMISDHICKVLFCPFDASHVVKVFRVPNYSPAITQILFNNFPFIRIQRSVNNEKAAFVSQRSSSKVNR
jgi:hypothetical protein